MLLTTRQLATINMVIGPYLLYFKMVKDLAFKTNIQGRTKLRVGPNIPPLILMANCILSFRKMVIKNIGIIIDRVYMALLNPFWQVPKKIMRLFRAILINMGIENILSII